MLTIGLTGSIGSGKTTVANLFARHDIPIIDADLIARKLTQPATDNYQKIVEHFSDLPVITNGILDRKKLRNFIFDHLKEKKWLEDLLHPQIRQEIQQQIQAVKNSPYCIVVIPLLIESGSYRFLNRILVVEASQDQQIARLMIRDGASSDMTQKILSYQATPEARLTQAHEVIHNHGNLDELKEQVDKLHQFYLKLAEKNSSQNH